MQYVVLEMTQHGISTHHRIIIQGVRVLGGRGEGKGRVVFQYKETVHLDYYINLQKSSAGITFRSISVTPFSNLLFVPA